MRVFLYKDLYNKYNYVSVLDGVIVIESLTSYVPRQIMAPVGRPFVSGADIPKVRRHCVNNKLDFIEMDATDYIRNGPPNETDTRCVVCEPDGDTIVTFGRLDASTMLSPSRLEGF